MCMLYRHTTVVRLMVLITVLPAPESVQIQGWRVDTRRHQQNSSLQVFQTRAILRTQRAIHVFVLDHLNCMLCRQARPRVLYWGHVVG